LIFGDQRLGIVRLIIEPATADCDQPGRPVRLVLSESEMATGGDVRLWQNESPMGSLGEVGRNKQYVCLALKNGLITDVTAYNVVP
jgi:hypothetical protein